MKGPPLMRRCQFKIILVHKQLLLKYWQFYDDADQDTESSIVRQSCPIFLLSDMKKYVLTTDLEFGNTFHLKVAHSGKK